MDNIEYIREQNRWRSQPAEQPVEKKGLPYTTIVLMFCLAGIFDGAQALLSLVAIGVIVSPFISVFAGMSFWFWFSMHEVSFVDWRRLSALLGGGLSELIPVIGALPFWIGIVWYIVRTTKTNEVLSKIPAGKTLARTIKK